MAQMGTVTPPRQTKLLSSGLGSQPLLEVVRIFKECVGDDITRLPHFKWEKSSMKAQLVFSVAMRNSSDGSLRQRRLRMPSVLAGRERERESGQGFWGKPAYGVSSIHNI